MEFLLSALEACGVDNARIEYESGTEVPVLDGSSQPWCARWPDVLACILHASLPLLMP